VELVALETFRTSAALQEDKATLLRDSQASLKLLISKLFFFCIPQLVNYLWARHGIHTASAVEMCLKIAQSQLQYTITR